MLQRGGTGNKQRNAAHDIWQNQRQEAKIKEGKGIMRDSGCVLRGAVSSLASLQAETGTRGLRKDEGCACSFDPKKDVPWGAQSATQVVSVSPQQLSGGRRQL